MTELNNLRANITSTKLLLWDDEAQSTTSVDDPNLPITFEECVDLISNCPDISDKEIVLRFAQK